MSETIKTSEPGWLTRVGRAYKQRESVVIVDDGRTGFDPESQTLMQFGLEAKLTAREWAGLGISLGMTAAGMAMVVMAVLDPEPTSKLGLLVGSGALCLLGGGFQALRILTRQKPPTVSFTARGIEIRWD